LNSGGISHQSSRIVNHPLYNDRSLENDVSVVQTATVISFNNQVSAIALGSAQVGGGVLAVVSGWGHTNHGGSAPNQLQALITRTLTNADCLNRLDIHLGPGFLSVTNICTLLQFGQGTCQGDSGGPLAAGGAVIGIASWAWDCGIGVPDGFERVSHFRTWILNSIG
jgi:trypsin